MEQSEYEKFIQQDKWIRERIEALFKMKGFDPGDIESIDFEQNGAQIKYQVRHCSCCSPDIEWEYFTADDIFGADEEVIKKFEAEQARKQEETRLAYEKARAQRAKDEEAAERKKFKELQKKYGG